MQKFFSFNRNLINKINNSFPFLRSHETYGADLDNMIKNFIKKSNPFVVIEFGGIDRPLLSKNCSYTYIGVDIEEKTSCHNIYDKFIVKSIEDDFSLKADLAISKTLLEHVGNNKKAINSVYNLLNNRGYTIHYVPSKFHPYSLILRLVGPKLQKIIIHYLRRSAKDVTGYPAFFNHCSCSKMYKIFKDIGFSNISVKPYYHATDYFAFFLPLYYSVLVFEKLVKYLGIHLFASGFIISAEKINDL